VCSGVGEECRTPSGVIVIAGVVCSAYDRPIWLGHRLVTGRCRRHLIAVHLAHRAEHGSCRDQQRQDEREHAELHDLTSIHAFYSSTRRSRRALLIADTELNVIAALAIIGPSSSPNHG
jgi:hypothetical protein